MKQHFGPIFLGVCIIIAALILTHPPHRQSHHYEWRVEHNDIGLLDSDTGEIHVLSTNGWRTFPPIPVQH